jgi:tRNA nucleotidyltransferase/poly(A) polymerase
MPSLDRALIDADADRVVRRLARHNYKAYLVGGCVRDLLCGRKPKDFDVATSATPNEVKALFRNCRIIGRRFRLATVFFGDKIIETSTFRANPREDEADTSADLLIRRDNVFGNETEDARRRDFTMNGLFYDVEAEEVIDHVGGLDDIAARRVRTIGDPEIRFQEDPVRMLRAVKFAARLSFQIEPATYRALVRWRHEIRKCPPPRVLEEVFRLLRGAAARRSMELLVETGLLAALSPSLSGLFEGAGAPVPSVPQNGDIPRSSIRKAEYEDVTDEDDGEDDAEDDAEDDDDAEDTDAELAADAAAADADSEDDTDTETDAVPVELDAEEKEWHRLWADESPAPRTHVAADAAIALAAAAPVAGDPSALVTRRKRAWTLLALLDNEIAAGREPSNAMVVGALLYPFILEDLTTARPADANTLVVRVGQPVIDQLRVPRRDSERLRQILLAQRRIAVARAKGGRPELLGGREFFEDATLLWELGERADGRSVEPIVAAPGAPDEGGNGGGDTDDTGPRKRRRRRRGGRRRRHEDQRDGAAA